jgi:D-alanine transfer protein
MLRVRNTWSEEAFLRTLERSREWTDLELLLRVLSELGARPLLLSMPVHGPWYDACGIRYNARSAYYEKLRAIGARYHAPVVDFVDHEADQSFCIDPMGHLAPNGLLYYGQVLDGFFHDAIPSLFPTRERGSEFGEEKP